MAISDEQGWIEEFGLAVDQRDIFLSSKKDLSAPGSHGPQHHVMRRAFDLLKLDGIFCSENTPLVYFKQVNRINMSEVVRLHRKFWNHGGAPVLVLVSPKDVHIYSGLSQPVPQQEGLTQIPSFVSTLARASTALREFLPGIESGEFFRRHSTSFNPLNRVDRYLLNNLQATRSALASMSEGVLDEKILDALLCRLVFACYLFDREIIGESYLRAIGIPGAEHLRDVLALNPKKKAETYLYRLFEALGQDFNGDLFSDDLSAERRQVSASYIETLADFFRGTDMQSGQGSFWPYDFSAIPVEAISAIYERFLRDDEKQQGAFYTPRFLAEFVLDIAVAPMASLLDRRYLDPACGSGLFLVALFNRIAEEWKGTYPDARNDRKARELRKLLCENLFGVDINPTACRITAFSLYLAYLDQLLPRDIQELQQRGHRLPKLVHYPDDTNSQSVEGNIWCGDFFTEAPAWKVDLVAGNPPWGSTAGEKTPSGIWCAAHGFPIPDKQIAAAFLWKAPHHVVDGGRICLVLPHGILFNHSTTTLDFQSSFFAKHAVDHVLNLVDYQFFLFAEARHPAIVMTYSKEKPQKSDHSIQYWSPKTDGLVLWAEVISVAPEDRSVISLSALLNDLEQKDAPQIWKQRHWATSRDRRLIDRLSILPRLRDSVRQTREQNGQRKSWLIAEGYQPVGKGDDPMNAEVIKLPGKLFIDAKRAALDLFLLPSDCTEMAEARVTVRAGSNKGTEVYQGPHVLVSQGFTKAAFADFHCSFRHALRGITGPKQDRKMLILLAAYFRSTLAKYFSFHTSSYWGVARQRVGVDELLRLPFPLPHTLSNPTRAWEIVEKISCLVATAAAESSKVLALRSQIVDTAMDEIEPLIDEYFDVLPIERVLIDDTLRITIPSVRPGRRRGQLTPTALPTTPPQREKYIRRLCDTLNDWAKASTFVVHGRTMGSPKLGIGLAILEKVALTQTVEDSTIDLDEDSTGVLAILDYIRSITSSRLNTFRLFRAVKVFDGNRLYVVKPIGQRFWTETAALNDADEIAGNLLLYFAEATA